jgi:hypothetical protein
MATKSRRLVAVVEDAVGTKMGEAVHLRAGVQRDVDEAVVVRQVGADRLEAVEFELARRVAGRLAVELEA